MSESMESRLKHAFAVLSARLPSDFRPKVALTLGTGLGAFADSLEPVVSVSYDELPDFPVATAPGHCGRFVFGRCGGVPVAVMQGRLHYYEGYTPSEAVMPLRLLRLLGAEILFLTNSSGGIADGLCAGDFMLVEDHISFFMPSALRGPNLDFLGPRFPDMSHVYDPGLGAIIRAAAEHEHQPLKSGIYVQTPGPAFETPAEIRLLKSLGADAVGMSTVIEAVAARHCGFRVCAVSCIANLAAGISPTSLTLEEVTETADRTAPAFRRLLEASIRAMAEA